MLLTSRKTATALAHHRVKPLGQALDKLEDVRLLGSGGDILIARVGTAIGDVVANSAVKQIHVLLHDANGAAQTLLRHIAHVLSIDGDGTGLYVVKARQQRARG